MVKSKKEMKELFKNEAAESEWDSLASVIMAIERLLVVEKDTKMLKLLKIRLKIFEDEKTHRVSEDFDMEYFINKEIQQFE